MVNGPEYVPRLLDIMKLRLLVDNLDIQENVSSIIKTNNSLVKIIALPCTVFKTYEDYDIDRHSPTLRTLNCNGSEEALLDCDHTRIGYRRCNSYGNAAVACFNGKETCIIPTNKFCTLGFVVQLKKYKTCRN